MMQRSTKTNDDRLAAAGDIAEARLLGFDIDSMRQPSLPQFGRIYPGIQIFFASTIWHVLGKRMAWRAEV